MKNRIFVITLASIVIINTIFIYGDIFCNTKSNELTVNELIRGLGIKYWILTLNENEQKKSGNLHLEWVTNNKVIYSRKIGRVKQYFTGKNKFILYNTDKENFNICFISGINTIVNNLFYNKNSLQTCLPNGSNIKINEFFLKFGSTVTAFKPEKNTKSRLQKKETGIKFVIK